MLEARPELIETREGTALAAAVWISLALNEAEVHGVERGLAAITEARRRADQVDDLALLARLHSQYGLIATRAGQFDLAVEQFGAAMAMIDHADTHDRFAILLNNGNLRLHRGELRQARHLLTLAAALAEEQGMDVGRFMALHNLGYAQFLAGSLPSALSSMESAASLDVPVSRGIAALDRARVLVEAGLTREADDTLAVAAAIFAEDRLAQDLAEVDVSRAECALLASDPAAARRFAARARDRFRRRGNDRWRRTAELVLLQGDLAVGRPGSRLAPVALRLEGELRADGLRARARTAALVAAEALLQTGNIADAKAAAAVTGPGSRSDPITVRLHSRYVAARLDLAGGDRAAGRRHVRAGLRELADYQSGFGGIDLRTASAIHGRRLAELDLGLAVEAGNPAVVLAAVERSRAVSSRLPAVQPPEDEQTAELLAELRRVVESVRAAQSDAAALQQRRHDLERRIAGRSWTLAGRGEVRKAADLAKVREALSATDATLVAYVQTGHLLTALTVSARRSRLVRLGDFAAVQELVRRARADFDVLAYERLPDSLRAAAAGSLLRSLEALDEALLAPLGLTDQRLVVVPTGILGALPWSSLPSRRDTPVVVAPSATAWLAARSSPTKSRTRVAALAGPDLARAAHEVGSIAAAWPSGTVEILSGRDALRAALATATVVHVAAHGHHQTENPLFSSIRLDDGPLFAHELVHTAAHVVLSACELGVATIRPGDEALGLTSVLLHLGTSSVVSGVARVADEAAAEAMIAYHQMLAAGRPSDESLATALARGRTPLPFVCFGASWANVTAQ
jgi:CHAT domain-containing protein